MVKCEVDSAIFKIKQPFQTSRIKRVEEQNNSPQHHLKTRSLVLTDVRECLPEHREVQRIEMTMGRGLCRSNVPGIQRDLQLPFRIAGIPVFKELGHRRCKNE